jgi:hypothetical protein
MQKNICTSMEQSTFLEANRRSGNEMPDFYETQTFNTVFTKVNHWPLSWAKRIKSIQSQVISFNLIITLSFNLCFNPSGVSTKLLYEFLMSPTRATSTQSVNVISLDLTTLIIFGDEYNKQNFKSPERKAIKILQTNVGPCVNVRAWKACTKKGGWDSKK